MSPPSQADQNNLLLRRMSEEDFALLARSMTPFAGQLGDVIFRDGDLTNHAIFLNEGIISLVAVSPQGRRAEAGLFGFEGFGPTTLALGDGRASFENTVQANASGHGVPAEAFRAALDASASLRAVLLRFTQVVTVQTGFTALSNAVHPVDQRLARWILMCDDRTRSGELTLTHEFLSVLLAVRRPSVTTALHVLEGNDLIRSERRLITVRNRAALEAFAGDAYGRPEREYERLLGPIR